MEAVARTVTAGVVVALLLFLLREFVFEAPRIGGPWYCLTKATEADLADYRGLPIGWRVVLASGSTGVDGAIEKMWEDGRGRLEGDQIDHGRGVGFLRANYLDATRLSLHQEITPVRLRKSNIYYFDMQASELSLYGSYYWTVSDQKGIIACQRDPVDWEDEEARERLLAAAGR